MKASPLVNLGADRVRMKDQRDVDRQQATVQHLLDRFYTDKEEEQYELQVVADEVGMGKTFVALATAFAMLEARREDPEEQKNASVHVLVLVPNNDALFRKWNKEVKEFVKRCVPEDKRTEVSSRFRRVEVERLDELVAALCQRNGPEVVVAKTSALAGKVRNFDAKARLVLATAFRVWANAFRLDARERLLRGGEKWQWPADPRGFGQLDELQEQIPLELAPLVKHIESELGGERGEPLLEACRECATPYKHNREALLVDIRKKAVEIYKEAVIARLTRAIPLVIVDEAHNWKNGPSKGSNNYREFARWIAPRARRLLLLTATPFQLRPDEMLEILKASDDMDIPEDRCERLRMFREKDIRTVLDESSRASKRFAQAWARIPTSIGPQAILEVWNQPNLVEARERLRKVADQHGALAFGEVDAAVELGARGVDPALREFFTQALRLFAFNRDLSQELGKLVVRHRRRTEHRLVRVGDEVNKAAEHINARPDARVLHASPGIDVRGEGELPHYLLMRASSEIKGGRGKAALGQNLTGCYSTLFQSADGKEFQKADSGRAREYVEVLKGLVGTEDADARHPKLAAVVADTVARWERGEKTLLFAFRSNTARQLARLIGEAIEARIDNRKKQAFGSDTGLQALRNRFTGKDRDLIPIVLDRVLWSALWAPQGKAFGPDALQPSKEDYWQVAELAFRYGVDVMDKTPDRVFLQRAVECAQARRLRTLVDAKSRARKLLEAVADESWVAEPYGGMQADDEEEAGTLVSEKGVLSRYRLVGKPTAEQVASLAQQLLERDAAAQRVHKMSALRTAFVGPSLWLGVEPLDVALQRWHLHDSVDDHQDQRLFHEHLDALTWPNGTPDFRTRALAMQAVRRAALRESLLVRLLPSAAELEDEAWATLLVQRIGEPLYPGGESLLRRLGVFLEDLASASGDIGDPTDARGALFDATRARGQSGVYLVAGDTKLDTRNRVFSGFNTPLLPEVLVCTQVGQEGIDLHRHCRHVVHYDLAWNPATLEQRTGRVDRIGSAAARAQDLRVRTGLDAPSYLEVDVPYLAGTYDERMFEELRLRAQTFEVLTGGELAADQAEGVEEEGEEQGLSLVTLPAEMVAELRVDLEVWRE
ncbi:MAG: DEAD/DEAH box helicase [Myxococcales bacterium]|nr:DEAD/DEAH box helicase [Myxococcales bacterium]MCB9583644.1 DEAD/DEAH box helicase [Polyangiaceae bacterium]